MSGYEIVKRKKSFQEMEPQEFDYNHGSFQQFNYNHGGEEYPDYHHKVNINHIKWRKLWYL